jgi:isocitrate lyase
VHEKFPGKLLAYNCSPSFNWRKHLDDDQIATFQSQLADWGYRFQFITLAGFHSVNAAMFELARATPRSRCPRTCGSRSGSSSSRSSAYTATRHQHEVGAGYFDLVTQAVSPDSETLALKGSTEEAQFTKEHAPA